MAYTIAFSDRSKRQLKALKGNERSAIEDAIYKYLSDQPDVESKIRKRLRPNPIAEWELRILRNQWRVLYNIYADIVEVEVIAIGRKLRERLFIDGEEVEL